MLHCACFQSPIVNETVHDIISSKYCFFFPLVYNTSSRETFDKLKEWLNQIEMYSTSKLDIIKMLVSNKIGKVR